MLLRLLSVERRPHEEAGDMSAYLNVSNGIKTQSTDLSE